jgi:hypothetical protein
MEYSIQTALATLRAAEWIPVTVARVLIGVFFCITGGTKLLVPSRFSELQETMIQSHIPFPHASALFVSLVEFACGGGLVLRTGHAALRGDAYGEHDRCNPREPDQKHPSERVPSVA